MPPDCSQPKPWLREEFWIGPPQCAAVRIPGDTGVKNNVSFNKGVIGIVQPRSDSGRRCPVGLDLGNSGFNDELRLPTHLLEVEALDGRSWRELDRQKAYCPEQSR